MMAGLGCFVSSMITLLIFFPRSIVKEAGYKPKVSSTLPNPNSPKSPSASPPARSGPFPPHPQAIAPQYQHHLPPHMAGYATPMGLRMSVTGGTGTGWTTTGVTGATTWEMEGSAYSHSLYSPRESLYDSPQYTAEDGDGPQRRGSRTRLSRRGSRRVSVLSGRPMDAHLEQDSDAEYEGDRETEREEEERVPPYSHPHPQPHPPPQSQTQSSQLPPPIQAHLHQRHPFTHSPSNTHVQTLATAPPSGTQTPLELPPPAIPPPAAPAVQATASPCPPPPDQFAPRSISPSSMSKRHTWDWEERRPSTNDVEARRSLHVITTAPGVNLGLGVMGTALGPIGGALGPGRVRGAAAGRGSGGSSLHPYVSAAAFYI